MQNHSETEEQLLFIDTDEPSRIKRNSTKSETISFSAETYQPVNVYVDSLVNSLNLKQRVILHVVTNWT